MLSDGSLDSSFIPNGVASGGPVYSIVRQGNGKIVIGGAFTTLNGGSFNRIGRLNPDGSLDAIFNPGAAASDEVLTLALQGDGLLLVGGLFANYNAIAVGMFTRIYGSPPMPRPFRGGILPRTRIGAPSRKRWRTSAKAIW